MRLLREAPKELGVFRNARVERKNPSTLRFPHFSTIALRKTTMVRSPYGRCPLVDSVSSTELLRELWDRSIGVATFSNWFGRIFLQTYVEARYHEAAYDE